MKAPLIYYLKRRAVKKKGESKMNYEQFLGKSQFSKEELLAFSHGTLVTIPPTDEHLSGYSSVD